MGTSPQDTQFWWYVQLGFLVLDIALAITVSSVGAAIPSFLFNPITNFPAVVGGVELVPDPQVQPGFDPADQGWILFTIAALVNICFFTPYQTFYWQDRTTYYKNVIDQWRQIGVFYDIWVEALLVLPFGQYIMAARSNIVTPWELAMNSIMIFLAYLMIIVNEWANDISVQDSTSFVASEETEPITMDNEEGKEQPQYVQLVDTQQKLKYQRIGNILVALCAIVSAYSQIFRYAAIFTGSLWGSIIATDIVCFMLHIAMISTALLAYFKIGKWRNPKFVVINFKLILLFMEIMISMGPLFGDAVNL